MSRKPRAARTRINPADVPPPAVLLVSGPGPKEKDSAESE